MNTNASTRPSPSPGLLGLIRSHARRAWFLHGYMVAMLVLLPVWPQVAQAEDDPPPEETWSEPVAQSCLLVNLTAPQGDTYLEGDSPKQLDATLERHSWFVSTSSLGSTSITGYEVMPVPNEVVHFSITSLNGNGVANSFSSQEWTGSGGRCTTTIPVDSAPSIVVQAAVTASTGESITSSFVFTKETPAEEEWSFSHSEALLHATLSADGGVELASAAQRTVTVNAIYETWDVYTSSLGNTETRNYYSSPATGASVSWTVDSGDGTITGDLSAGGQLDAGGTGTAVFTMGDTESSVRVDLGYLTSTTASAVLVLTQPAIETWAYDRTEGYITTTLNVPNGSSGIAGGVSRQMDATVTLTTWEIWSSSQGNTETRNHSSGPAIGTPVTFNITSGDGSLNSSQSASPVTITTNGDGRASTSFQMGATSSNVTATAYYNSSESSSSVEFTPPTEPIWFLVDSYQELLVTVAAGNTTAAIVPVTATMNYHTWEVWQNDQTGETETRNDTTSAALYAPTIITVTSGNGSVSAPGSTTTSTGAFGASYTAGSEASEVTVSSTFTTANGTVSGSGSITISNLDTDGDGHSDVDEVAAGSDPLSSTSTPGNTGGGGGGGGGGGARQTQQYTNSGTWIETVTITEELRSIWTVKYTVTVPVGDGTTNTRTEERTAHPPDEVCRLGNGAISIHLNLGPNDEIKDVKSTQATWEQISSVPTDDGGMRAAEFDPAVIVPIGWDFSRYILPPVDNLIEGPAEVEVSNNGQRRVRTITKKFHWNTIWEAIEEP